MPRCVRDASGLIRTGGSCAASFKALGWDVDNLHGYAEAYKHVVHEDSIKIGGSIKAPDYSFRIGGVRKFFVETKKPAVNLDQDVSPAYQLRRYASPYEFSVFGADILGHVYEQFLGKVIRLTKGHRAVVEDKPEVKKAGGVYYTPTYIVDYIVEQTVGKLLEGKMAHEVAARTKTWKPSKRGRPLTVLDPACGSGSFLIGAYQYFWTGTATGTSSTIRPNTRTASTKRAKTNGD